MRTLVSIIIFFFHPLAGVIIGSLLFLEWMKKKNDIDTYAKGLKRAKERGYLD